MKRKTYSLRHKVVSFFSDWSQNEKEILRRTTHSIISILRNHCNKIDEEHFKLINELDKKFWNYKNDLAHCKPNQYHHFSSESIILSFSARKLHLICVTGETQQFRWR